MKTTNAGCCWRFLDARDPADLIGESRNDTRLFAPKPETVREACHPEHDIARLADVVLEDLANVERTHESVAARVKNEMILQDNEVLIRRYLKLLERFRGAARGSNYSMEKRPGSRLSCQIRMTESMHGLRLTVAAAEG